MTLGSLIIVLIVLGVLLWAFNTYFTAIDATAKKIINFVIIVVMVLICLQAFGVVSFLNMPVPRIG